MIATVDSAFCRACRSVRPLDELLLVTMTRTGETSFVCRPSLPLPGLRTPCFVTVPAARFATIALAVPR